MKSISIVTLALASGIALASAVQAQPSSTPNTTNPVPTDCARLTDQSAKAACARGYNQGGLRGEVQGTGVGKGQGQGQGVGQGSGQGATHGIGTGNKK